MNALADKSVQIATAGAVKYLKTKGLTADPETLAVCIGQWVRIKLPEAIRDAKEALSVNMDKVAGMTFTASMIDAGIQAAREASTPPRTRHHGARECSACESYFTPGEDDHPRTCPECLRIGLEPNRN